MAGSEAVADHGSDDGHDHRQTVTADNERRIRFDSGHMVSDAAALLLALIAYRVARRPVDSTRTYGFHRVRVLAALANGASLLLLVAWITWEAVNRINDPHEVLAGPMLIVAVIGLAVNLAGAWILSRGRKGDANLKGAFLHVIGDLLGSVGAMLTGWTLLDPILSVLVAILVVRSAWTLVKESIRVLLQAVPRGLDARRAETEMAELPEIEKAGHFHAWTLTDETVVATVHVVPSDGTDPLILPALVSGWLKSRYDIDHVTVQVDPPGTAWAADTL
mgnify:CR=1 FL=1